jgi:hypothetical protein
VAIVVMLAQRHAQFSNEILAEPPLPREIVVSLTGKSTADVELEKLATPPDVYQYRWVHIRISTHLQKEVSRATAEGFHAFPQSLAVLVPYLTVLMEKPPGPSTIQYQYLVSDRANEHVACTKRCRDPSTRRLYVVG